MVGVVQQGRSRRYLKIVKPVRVDHEGGFADSSPPKAASASTSRSTSNRRRLAANAGCSISIRRLSGAISPAPALSDFVSDVQALWRAGYALGSSLENSVAIDGDAVLNPEGLRYADEFVRHKALDAVAICRSPARPSSASTEPIAPDISSTRWRLRRYLSIAPPISFSRRNRGSRTPGSAGGAHVPAGAAAFAAAD